MSENQYDLVILGGGTAGYVAAIRASQLGNKVAIVEIFVRWHLSSQRMYSYKSFIKICWSLRTVKDSVHFGVNVGQYSFDLKSMMKRKDKIVNQMHQGIESLMQKNHIDIFNGTGRIMGTSIFSPQSGTISVEYDNVESELLPNQNVLIATGSLPTQLPFLPFNHNTVLSSNDILQLTDLPASIAIIGGGVIGLEFASLLIDLGVNVSVIEAGERILPNEVLKLQIF